MARPSIALSYAIRLSIALYIIFSFFVIQKAHINSPYDAAAELSKHKQKFIVDSRGGKNKKGGIIQQTQQKQQPTTTSKILSELHRPVSQIFNNPKLPDWVKTYAKWHAQQRQQYFNDMRANGTSNVRFLISRCLTHDKCGGASDRLQEIPYSIMLANQTNRVLLVRWEKPARLENYLVVPKDEEGGGGIDWTVPDDMFPEGMDWHLRGKEDGEHKIVSTIRRDSAAPKFRQYQQEELGGNKIYHEIFRLLFAPSEALTARIHSTMKSLQLTPKEFSSVHLRVKYPVRGIKENEFSFQKHKSQITSWATNAVNCAAELHPNSTIYVSSDNNDTVGYLLEESHFAQHYIDATEHKKHPLVVKLVARDYSTENEHVAFSQTTEVDGFMSVFEDLFIMGLGKCVAHGVGGYGRLAAALCGGECVTAHRKHGGSLNMCSDALKDIQRKIDKR
eukprot:CAMPEP_0201718054 /NCGR_PEP_ID=MMETSP0593-20130828/3634_1 /ASSEMBLY_ACC=CAM_ASM_000672 /TAXON_ID=267983 /ORGANISM="Skeletonema japonicum, Strain CCMP2506" /LENGTH=447 /DNA_ID=CAMNT_0048208237 /DNA_START=6 /DNA_END=1349 /DNA_ORIENTATION=-